MKLVMMAAATLALSGCASTRGEKAPKPPPPPPVCVQYDTSEVLFSYGPALAREQTITDLTKRIDRYLKQYLRERSIPAVQRECNAQTDTVLSVKLDALEPISNSKIKVFVGPIRTNEVKLKYRATLVAPGVEKPLFEADDDPVREGLDDLAEKVASRLYKWTRQQY